MLFKILGIRQRNGCTKILLETSEHTCRGLLQFFELASEFGQSFFYQVKAEQDSRERERVRLASEFADRMERANLLSLFRTLKGSPSSRIRQIRGILQLQGIEERYSDIEAKLSLARESENKERKAG